MRAILLYFVIPYNKESDTQAAAASSLNSICNGHVNESSALHIRNNWSGSQHSPGCCSVTCISNVVEVLPAQVGSLLTSLVKINITERMCV